MARSAAATARSRKAGATRLTQSLRSIAEPVTTSADEAPSSEADQSGTIGRFLPAKKFWELMERRTVPDPVAVELLNYSDKPGPSGKRPRFRFLPHQKLLTIYLKEIDAAMTAGGEDFSWLNKKIRGRLFEGRPPVAYMVEKGMDGMAEVLRILTETALRRSLRRQGPAS